MKPLYTVFTNAALAERLDGLARRTATLDADDYALLQNAARRLRALGDVTPPEAFTGEVPLAAVGFYRAVYEEGYAAGYAGARRSPSKDDRYTKTLLSPWIVRMIHDAAHAEGVSQDQYVVRALSLWEKSKTQGPT